MLKKDDNVTFYSHAAEAYRYIQKSKLNIIGKKVIKLVLPVMVCMYCTVIHMSLETSSHIANARTR